MHQRSLASLATAAALLSASLVGCGGSNSGGFSQPVTSPPTTMGIQPGNVLNTGNVTLSTGVAVKGPTIAVGVDANQLNAVWVGSKEIFFNTDLSQASLYWANFDYAIGTYANGSFIWPYRLGKPPIVVLSDTLESVAKNSNLFLDIGLLSDGITQTASLVSLKNNKPVLTPYILPTIDFTVNGMAGIAINNSGLALIDVSPEIALRGPAKVQAMRAYWKSVSGPLVGNANQRLEQLKHRMKPATTASATGYYLVSTTLNPIPLAMPAGAFSVVVLSMNDKGISVGAAYSGDPNNPNLTPAYWDAQGNAYSLQLTSDLTFGYGADINTEGTVVGESGNDVTTFGAMWNTVASTPVNINALLPTSSAFDIQYVASIGDDFTMAASAVSTTDSTMTFYLGLNPY